MVTVLHLMLKRFHHFTELKKNTGNQTNLATIYIHTITLSASYFKIDQRFIELKSLNVQNIARSNFKQLPFNVLQEKLNLANVRNNLICQPLSYIVFGLQKTK